MPLIRSWYFMLYNKLQLWKYMNIPIRVISTGEKPKVDILNTMHILITTNTNVVIAHLHRGFNASYNIPAICKHNSHSKSLEIFNTVN